VRRRWVKILRGEHDTPVRCCKDSRSGLSIHRTNVVFASRFIPKLLKFEMLARNFSSASMPRARMAICSEQSLFARRRSGLVARCDEQLYLFYKRDLIQKSPSKTHQPGVYRSPSVSLSF
jgi:hypothetical protein